MTGLFTQNSHTILPGRILAGIAHESKTLHIAGGLAWVTIEGMPDDHWLGNGDILSIPPDRLIVVEAGKSPSRINIRPARTDRGKQAGNNRLGQKTADTGALQGLQAVRSESNYCERA